VGGKNFRSKKKKNKKKQRNWVRAGGEIEFQKKIDIRGKTKWGSGRGENKVAKKN
jgi:hypothetical protein